MFGDEASARIPAVQPEACSLQDVCTRGVEDGVLALTQRREGAKSVHGAQNLGHHASQDEVVSVPIWLTLVLPQPKACVSLVLPCWSPSLL